MKNIILITLFVICSLFSPITAKECSPIYKEAIIPIEEPKPGQDVWITVFVHGIMSIKPHLTAHNFIRFMRDDIGNTIYEKTVEIMCQDSFFYQNQIMQGYGLRAIAIDNESLDKSTNTMTRIYDDITKSIEGDHIKNYYFSFGWSALLSPTVRYLDAKKLFEALEQKVLEFKKKGIEPKVRVIGYSHGGNVSLNLAAIRQDFYPLSPLSVDELILVGIPIQTENDYLVGDQLFKKVFNFYSAADRIQPIDFFAFNRFFSQKTFKSRRQFKLPSNLFQVNLKIMKTTGAESLSSSRFERRKELAANFDDPAIISGQSHLLRDISPGHIELWFFGWTPQHFRSHFPLSPLPAFVFIPLIIHYLNNDENQLDYRKTIIADLRPDQEAMVLKQYKKNCYQKVVPFVTKAFRDYLEKIALKGKPECFSAHEYDKHIRDAYEKAVCLKQEEMETNPPVTKVNKRTAFKQCDCACSSN